jgi:3-deoxy-manno-octulosonate cytidylyltransferase (CMP-KDO synthetase)
MGRKSFLVVLPARYGSTRFPGKPLADIAGRPLIEWVYRRAAEIRGAGEVVVATDDRRIADAVAAFGGNVAMTSTGHATGTDRVAEVALNRDYPLVVNLQGDEPVFDPATVESMVELLASDPDSDIATACHPVGSEEEFKNPNIVKVVFDSDGRALYFSRSPVPNGAWRTGQTVAYRHVGIYAYRKKSLLRFTSLEPSPLEISEKLEQLRALESGMVIRVIVTDQPTLGVDVPSDVKKVEKELGRIYTGPDS